MIPPNGAKDWKDNVSWTWVTGEAADISEFGDPTNGSAFDLCVYDETNGVSTLVNEIHIPAGGPWKSSRGAFEYDADPLDQNGLLKVLLRAGKRPKVLVQAKGASVQLPSLPLSQDRKVTVQLVGENTCWGAEYRGARKNSNKKFLAISD